MQVWMYYETDGDSGYYAIRLFSSRKAAERYRKQLEQDTPVEAAYGHIKPVEVRQDTR
jgi:hypothetical protein